MDIVAENVIIHSLSQSDSVLQKALHCLRFPHLHLGLFMFEFLNMLIAVLSPFPFTTLHRETCKIACNMLSGMIPFM